MSETNSLGMRPQPNPSSSDHPAIWDMVIADMKARDLKGLESYGTRLKAFNGRDALVDAYQEMLDAAVYLRQAIYERDNNENPDSR